MSCCDGPAAGPLSTERLGLRPPLASDLGVLSALSADPAAQRFCAYRAPTTPAAVQDQLNDWLSHWQGHGFGPWAMSLREAPDAPLGFGGLIEQRVGDQAGLYLYYRLFPEYWGRGLACEMAHQAFDLAFETLGASEVFAAVLPSNTPTRKTLQALGLRLRGILADRPGDPPRLLYEITAEDWAHQPRIGPEPIPFAA